MSRSTLIVRTQSPPSHAGSGLGSTYSTEQLDKKGLTEFVRTTQCRRVVLAKWFDGPEATPTCIQGGWVPCDICSHSLGRIPVDARSEGEAEGSELIAKQSYDMIQDDERIVQVMGELQHGCLYCLLIFERY